ncbi:IS110 family transposase [Streptomyces sp. NPDC094147]
MMTPSFVPPAPVRRLRDLTRARAVFTQERSRHKQRAEKLLEDAQIKLTTVATDAFGVPGRAMMDAMTAGRRDPRELARLAKGRMTTKYDALVEALTGNFNDHHGYLLKVFLDTIDHLSAQIADLDREIETAIAELPGPDNAGSGTARGPGIIECLDAIPGVGPHTAQILLAELGPDMRAFPTADHLTSWAKLCPRTVQSGAKNGAGRTGKGNPWLKALGEAAMTAARTDTFLGARYRRLVKHMGHAKALVAVARSILVIAWHLIDDPDAAYHDLGADWHQRHLDPARKTRDLVRQLERLGHQVTLVPTAA